MAVSSCCTDHTPAELVLHKSTVGLGPGAAL